MAREAIFHGEPRFSDIRPVAKQEIRLSDGVAFLEERENRALGWTGANVFFGEPTPVTDLARILQVDLQGHQDFQGFTHLYRYPKGTSLEQAEAWEAQAANLLINYLLEKSGVSPEQIGYVGLACGTPIGDHYLERLIGESGVNFQNDTIFSETSTACNSGTRELARAYEAVKIHPHLHEKYAMIIALEGLGRHLLEEGGVRLNELGDPYSLMVFGNGLGGMVWPIDSMRIITNKTATEPDRDGNLAAIMSYDINPRGPLIQKVGGKERIVLPHTQGKYKIFMNPLAAARMFLGFAQRKFAPEFDPRIKVISAHHPASQMVEGFRRALSIDDNLLPFVVNEGNMSGATETIARNRLMENFRHGDTVAFMGVGAGMQGTFIKAKIG